MNHRPRQLALACVLALSVSGCGGGNPTPAPGPTSSPTSRTASPQPVRQDPATGVSVQAAESLVRYFVDSLNYGGRTGDTAPLRSTFSKHCAACLGVSQFIEKTEQAGGRIEGSGWKILKMSHRREAGALRVVATVRVSPQQIVAKAGAKPTDFPGAPRARKDFTLIARAGEWHITQIDSDQ